MRPRLLGPRSVVLAALAAAATLPIACLFPYEVDNQDTFICSPDNTSAASKSRLQCVTVPPSSSSGSPWQVVEDVTDHCQLGTKELGTFHEYRGSPDQRCKCQEDGDAQHQCQLETGQVSLYEGCAGASCNAVARLHSPDAGVCLNYDDGDACAAFDVVPSVVVDTCKPKASLPEGFNSKHVLCALDAGAGCDAGQVCAHKACVAMQVNKGQDPKCPPGFDGSKTRLYKHEATCTCACGCNGQIEVSKVYECGKVDAAASCMNANENEMLRPLACAELDSGTDFNPTSKFALIYCSPSLDGGGEPLDGGPLQVDDDPVEILCCSNLQ